ncbi:MAG: thioesterase family protein [Chloroflexi bacterium]|nr:thioesterase family protein [Chloroflexota bacterium]
MSRIKTSLSEIRQLDRAYELAIPQDFLDENSHVNVQYYLHLVERGLGRVFERVGLGAVYAAADPYGNFALEQHIRYFAEILVDERVSVHIRLVDLSSKRAYFMGFLMNETREQLSAIVEVVMMNVDMIARRGAAFPADSYRDLETMLRRHQELKWEAPICGVMSV